VRQKLVEFKTTFLHKIDKFYNFSKTSDRQVEGLFSGNTWSVKTAENTTKPGLYACMHAHLAVKLTMKILSGHFTFPLVLTIKGRVLASFECYYCNRPRKNAYIIEWRFKLFSAILGCWRQVIGISGAAGSGNPALTSALSQKWRLGGCNRA